MILVAGLVVAGLAGIAAAFYFSMRPGGSRVRAAEPDGTSARRLPGSRPRDDLERPAAAHRTRHAASRAAARAADLPAEPGLLQAPAVLAPPVPTVTVPAMETPDLVKTESQPAALLTDPADEGGVAKAPRSRRRMGWRKGAEVDQELWPTEAFGGVTDEQFWDDLAADKPLATTARTAQPESGSRNHPDPGSRSQRDSRSRRRKSGAVPLPGARSDWTATQPAPIAARATHAARQPAESRGMPDTGTGSFADTGGFAGSGVSVDEDPLTSPAYALRPRGAVDGRSRQPSRGSRDLSREQHEAANSQSTQTFSSADIQAASGGYPGGVPLRWSDPLRSDPLRSDPLRSDGYRSGSAGSPTPLRTISTPGYQPSLGSANVGAGAYPYPEQPPGGPIQSMNTPPYGEKYGYGNPVSPLGPVGPVGPVGGPRQPSGTRGYGQPGGRTTTDGNLGSHYSYPPAAGYRGPYGPRGNDRR